MQPSPLKLLQPTSLCELVRKLTTHLRLGPLTKDSENGLNRTMSALQMSVYTVAHLRHG